MCTSFDYFSVLVRWTTFIDTSTLVVYTRHVLIKRGVKHIFGNNKDILTICGRNINQNNPESGFLNYATNVLSCCKNFTFENLGLTITSACPQWNSVLSVIRQNCIISQGKVCTVVVDKFMLIWFVRVLRTRLPIITQISFHLLILWWKD